jgi:predicted secreted Zn-dependent protease
LIAEGGKDVCNRSSDAYDFSLCIWYGREPYDGIPGFCPPEYRTCDDFLEPEFTPIRPVPRDINHCPSSYVRADGPTLSPYTVEGSTLAEVMADIVEQRPKWNGKPIIGETKHTYTKLPAYQTQNGKVVEICFAAQNTIILPDFQDVNKLSQKAQKEWNRFYTGYKNHEDYHVDIMLQYINYDYFDATMSGKTPEDATAEFRKIWSEMLKASKSIDPYRDVLDTSIPFEHQCTGLIGNVEATESDNQSICGETLPLSENLTDSNSKSTRADLEATDDELSDKQQDKGEVDDSMPIGDVLEEEEEQQPPLAQEEIPLPAFSGSESSSSNGNNGGDGGDSEGGGETAAAD